MKEATSLEKIKVFLLGMLVVIISFILITIYTKEADRKSCNDIGRYQLSTRQTGPFISIDTKTGAIKVLGGSESNTYVMKDVKNSAYIPESFRLNMSKNKKPKSKWVNPYQTKQE